MVRISVADEQWEMRELPKLNTITIAKVGYLPHADVYPEVDGNQLTDRGRARARMMVASPDMLRALREAEAFIAGFVGDEGQDPPVDERLARIRAAIAKAEG